MELNEACIKCQFTILTMLFENNNMSFKYIHAVKLLAHNFDSYF